MKKTIPEIIDNNFFLFLVFIVLGSSIALYVRADLVMDFANYHYHLAHKFITNSAHKYFVPDGANGFLNPLIELPLYFYIKYFNDTPNIIFALQGIWYGMSLFFLYKIITLFYEIKSFNNVLFLIFCLFLATTRQAIWIQIGSSTNEIPMLFLDLWGLYIIFKMLKYPNQQKLLNFIVAGLVMGIAVGLKQTAGHVAISIGLVLILYRKQIVNPYKIIFVFALCGLAGFMIVNGYFIYDLWIKYGNPFFPFLNNIFKSEYAPEIPFSDTRLELKFYHSFLPYFLYFVNNPLCSRGLKDHFIILGYTLLVAYFILKWCKYNKLPDIFNNKLLEILAALLLIDWFVWINMFGILRYAVVYSSLISFFIPYVFLKIYEKSKNKYYIVFVFILFIVLVYPPFSYRGTNFRHNITKYIDVEEVKLPPNSLVKIYGHTSSFLIPALEKNNDFTSVSYYPMCFNKFCGYFGNGSDFVETHKFRSIRNEIEQNHQGPIVHIYNEKNYNLLKNYKFHKKLLKRSYDLNFISQKYYEEKLKVIIGEEKNSDKKLINDIKNNYNCRELWHNLYDVGNFIICIPKDHK